MNPSLINGMAVMLIVNIMVWYQVNLQFVNPWWKNYTGWLSLVGFPISYLIIKGTEMLVQGLDGVLWPSRLITFGIGIVVFAVLTYMHIGEGINMKAIVSVTIAIILVLMQVIWK